VRWLWGHQNSLKPSWWDVTAEHQTWAEHFGPDHMVFGRNSKQRRVFGPNHS